MRKIKEVFQFWGIRSSWGMMISRGSVPFVWDEKMKVFEILPWWIIQTKGLVEHGALSRYSCYAKLGAFPE
jgi:hypothetical protein